MNHLNIFHQIILLNHIRDEHFITEEIYAENMRQRETVENDLICKRQRTTHAMNCVVAEAFAMVGRGHPQNGMPKRQNDIPPFNRVGMQLLLDNPAKLDNSIFFNSQEFYHLVVPFEDAMVAIGYNPRKVGYDGALFIILYYITKRLDFQDLENMWHYSKSSCQELVARGGPILLQILKNILGRLFPNDAEQEILVSMLPPILRDARPIMLVDTSITLSVDSRDSETTTTHMDRHKGFGGNALLLPISSETSLK